MIHSNFLAVKFRVVHCSCWYLLPVVFSTDAWMSDFTLLVVRSWNGCPVVSLTPRMVIEHSRTCVWIVWFLKFLPAHSSYFYALILFLCTDIPGFICFFHLCLTASWSVETIKTRSYSRIVSVSRSGVHMVSNSVSRRRVCLYPYVNRLSLPRRSTWIRVELYKIAAMPFRFK